MREVGREDVEELHEACWDVFGGSEIVGQREAVAPAAVGACKPVGDAWVGNGREVGGTSGDVAEFEVARCKSIERRFVELVELAVFVYQDGPLEWCEGVRVVTNGVVAEVVDDFEGDEEAWLGDRSGPVEN